MRIRKAQEGAVIKTLSFLQNLKIKYDEGENVDSNNLQIAWGISKSTFSICRKLNFIKGGKWIVDEPTRLHALQILEVLRQQASRRIDVAIDDSFITAIDRLTAKLDIISVSHESSLNGLKTPLLNKALNQAEQNPGNHLFSKVENDESKKFELLKSISSGWYAQYDHITPYQNVNDSIILATEDLFNKFFSKK